MPAIRTDNLLGWASFTSAINEVKPPANFIRSLLFSTERTYATDVLEIGTLFGDRRLAPFVKVGAEGKSVVGYTTKFANISPPNIRIKRPMEAYSTMQRRMPGKSVFPDGSDATAGAIQEAMMQDTAQLSNMIDNRIEWMAAQIAQFAGVTYASPAPDTQGDNFQILYPRSAAFGANTGVVLTGTNRWAVAGVEGATSNPVLTFDSVKTVMSSNGGAPTMFVGGERCIQGLINHSKVKDAISTQKNQDAGKLTLMSQYNEQGAIYYGNLQGIEIWKYGRTYTDDAGVEQPFLASDNGFFISNSAVAANQLAFGPIPDFAAFAGGMITTKKFSKAWATEDPSTYTQLAHTRPLPVLTRPDVIYSIVSTAP